MRHFVPWAILVGVFIVAAGGINLIRAGIANAVTGAPDQWWMFALGGAMTAAGTAYLGGFVYYRDRKRGRIKRPDWARRPPRN